jgi:hypothetical protein
LTGKAVKNAGLWQLSVQTGAIALVSVVDVVLVFRKIGGRPVAIYLLVNVLNIYADNADDVNDVDDVDDVGDVSDVGDVGDADLAKTLLPTLAVFLFVVE